MSPHLLSALRATPYFRDLGAGALEPVLADARWWTVERGADAPAGRERPETMILAAGAARIMRTVRSDRSVAVSLLARGDLFGALPGSGRTATVDRVEFLASSEVVSLPAAAFEAAMLGHPRVALRVIEAMSGRLAAAERRLVAAGSQPVPARIAAVLLEVGERYGDRVGGEVHVELILTHGQIAELATTTRETVTKVASWLRRLGIVLVTRRQIRITDPDALGRIAAGAWPMPGRIAGAA